MKKCIGIITHPQPHLDEGVGIFLLLKYGEEKYPGVKDVIANRNILFLRENEFTTTAENYEDAGYLLLGVGGGRFDEHATAKNDGRKEGECVATLVAKDLGIEKNPELRQILKFVTNVDLNPVGQPFEISSLMKLVVQKDSLVAIDWLFIALQSKLEEQYEFMVAAPKAAETACREQIGDISLAVVETDCGVVSKYLRTKEGGRADMIIQKSPTTGQVQIFTNQKENLDVSRLVVLIRLLERKISKKTDKIRPDELVREGCIESVPNWHCVIKAGQLLNGSRTSPHTPATKIPLKVIIGAVRCAVNKKNTEADLEMFVERFRV